MLDRQAAAALAPPYLPKDETPPDHGVGEQDDRPTDTTNDGVPK